MLFNVNVAAIFALALAMSAYATPFEPSKPEVPAVSPPVPRDVGAPAGQGPTARVNKPTDSDPTVFEGKSFGHSKRKKVEELVEEACR
ncbi:hypothetical protein F5146DRAFT_1074822 [Armillaria mellea]|nr:hypothetical protein F5146DRAFT_1074822 [Armillaria mellea]